MRYYFFFFVPVALLFSCKGEETNEPVIQSDQSISRDSLVDPQAELMEPDSMMQSNLTAFPKHWVQVDVKHKEIIYTEFCGMGHPYLKVIETDSAWFIETFYGQDGETWRVQNMTANLQSAEDQIFQEGIFVVTKETYPDNEIYEVSYFWNQTARFCTFGEFFNKETKFADESLSDSFTIKKEDCDD
jgi:hypothetical protein